MRFRRMWLACLTIGSLGFAAALAADEAAPQKCPEALQGKWYGVSIEAVGGNTPKTLVTQKLDIKGLWMIFEGDEMVKPGTGADGKPIERRLKLTFEPDMAPRKFALQTTNPDKFKIRYIYEVKGDTLRMCCFDLAEVDGVELVEWPTNFSLDENREKGPRLEIWKRVKEEEASRKN